MSAAPRNYLAITKYSKSVVQRTKGVFGYTLNSTVASKWFSWAAQHQVSATISRKTARNLRVHSKLGVVMGYAVIQTYATKVGSVVSNILYCCMCQRGVVRQRIKRRASDTKLRVRDVR